MILGMSTSAFTTLHVVVSLIAMVASLVVLADLLASRLRTGWTAAFLATTVATSASGFLFPADTLLPSHVVGILSLLALAIAIFALYVRRLAGLWRPAYAISTVLAFYLNVFVGVVQAFQKFSPLQALAPTQSEPPFLVVQLAVLLTFVALGIRATSRFREESRFS